MSKRIRSFEQLKTLLQKSDYNRPNDFGKEGEDHINVSWQSKTPIGKRMMFDHNARFNYPLVGEFSSPLALEAWLKADGEIEGIRYLHSREILAKLRPILKGRLENFRAILLHAVYLSVKGNKESVAYIKRLPKNIPVVSYTINKDSGLRISTPMAATVCPIAEEIIRAIQEDREPNYQYFLPKGNKDCTVENGFLENSKVYKNIVQIQQKQQALKAKKERKGARIKDAVPNSVKPIESKLLPEGVEGEAKPVEGKGVGKLATRILEKVTEVDPTPETLSEVVGEVTETSVGEDKVLGLESGETSEESPITTEEPETPSTDEIEELFLKIIRRSGEEIEKEKLNSILDYRLVQEKTSNPDILGELIADYLLIRFIEGHLPVIKKYEVTSTEREAIETSNYRK